MANAREKKHTASDENRGWKVPTELKIVIVTAKKHKHNEQFKELIKSNLNQNQIIDNCYELRKNGWGSKNFMNSRKKKSFESNMHV